MVFLPVCNKTHSACVCKRFSFNCQHINKNKEEWWLILVSTLYKEDRQQETNAKVIKNKIMSPVLELLSWSKFRNSNNLEIDKQLVYLLNDCTI